MSATPRKTPARPAGELMKPGNIEIIDSEADDARITKVGTWSSVEDATAAGLTYVQSKILNASIEFKFRGTALWLRFIAGTDKGRAAVSIDGGSEITLEMYDEIHRPRMSWLAPNLTPNVEHKVKIRVKYEKDGSSTDYYVSVDSFTVELAPGALQTWSMIEEGLLVKTEVTIGTTDDRGIYKATPPTLADEQKHQLTLTSDGALRVKFIS